MSNNKGFTTIELILAILIAGIIMGAVGTFLTFNLGSFNTTTDVIDIQYEGQLLMNQMVSLLRESEGFDTITGNTVGDLTVEDKIDATYEVVPDTFEFKHYEWDGSSELETGFQLVYDAANGVLINTTDNPTGTDPTYDMGRYIESFTLEPVGNDFQECDNVIIRLTLEEGGSSIELETQVKIRNKQ